MSRNELLTFILCVFVFVVFVILFIVLIVMLYKYNKRVVLAGLDDEKLKSEYVKNYHKQKCKKVTFYITQAIFSVLGIFFLSVFLFSVTVNLTSHGVAGDIPIYQVVKSDSMSYKHEENKYLYEYDEKYEDKMSYGFQLYDMILTHKLPGEFELELYDVVVYEVNNINVIHRIIEIEEPNENHPEHRYFRLKGDANTSADRFPVKYEQMKAIYKGNRIPYVGSFVLFLQSAAGYLCISLILFYLIATPILENKLEKTKIKRLTDIGYIEQVKREFGSGKKGDGWL